MEWVDGVNAWVRDWFSTRLNECVYVETRDGRVYLGYVRDAQEERACMDTGKTLFTLRYRDIVNMWRMSEAEYIGEYHE